jgi:hypothetical protein
MEKKRSAGVTVVAIIMLVKSSAYIIGNLLLLCTSFMPESLKAHMLSKITITEMQIMERSIKLLIDYGILFVLGIGVLRLSNLMRKITIWYSVISLISVLLAIILFKKSYGVPQFAIYILLNSFLVYFFTRSKVKEQFK